MTIPEYRTPPPPTEQRTGKSGGHSWLMIACCIPMLAVAVALVATGVAGPGFLLVAVLCTAMMAMMMGGMHGGGQSGQPPQAGGHNH
jgi:hypothetical protein